MVGWKIFVGVVIISGLCACSAAEASDYSDALSLFQKKDYRGATAKFESAMKADPRNPNTVYYCALANQLSNNWSRARQLYQYIGSSFPGTQVAEMAATALKQMGGGASSTDTSTPQPTTPSAFASQITNGGNGGSEPPEVRIPFERGAGGHVYVVASINGRSVRFALDTGAFGTTIGENRLEELGMARPANTQKFRMGGVGERTDVVGWVQKVDFKLGPIYRRDFPLVVQDRSEADPLLGANFLNNFETIVDNDSGQVILRKKGYHPNRFGAPGSKDIPYTVLSSGHMIVKAQVNGKPCNMMFDTGASGVCFSINDCQRLNIDIPPLPPTITNGIGGAINTWNTTADIKLGPVEKDGIVVRVLDQKLDYPLLGQNFFGDYSLDIDRENHIIHLRQ